MGESLTGQQSQLTVLAVLILSLIIIGAFVYLYYTDANPGVHLVLDWRFHITIDNFAAHQNLTIPANIGVAGGIWMNHTLDGYGPPGYAPLSTRDTTGTIYIQAVAPRLFLLSEFFSIWGKYYNSTCVGFDGGYYCSSTRPPALSNGNSEYCLSQTTPPIDNGLSWIIIIDSDVGRGIGC